MHPLGVGATDWTCFEFKKNKDRFLKSIIKRTNYTRIVVYDNFYHCDYHPTESGRREIHTSNAASDWKFLRFAD